jgi:hypothetical protein
MGCSRYDCKSTLHLPCALSEEGSLLFFHAKMVYFCEKKHLRPARFHICSHHEELDSDDDWQSVKSYVTNHPELVGEGGISVDVDMLPLTMQVTVSEMGQLAIFSSTFHKNLYPGMSVSACQCRLTDQCSIPLVLFAD